MKIDKLNVKDIASPPNSWRSLLVLVLLTLTALGGNYFSVSLFFGVDLLFGSIFVLLVIAFYSVWWGGLVALLASSYTLQLWGHPYAIIIFTLEALCVGWFWQRYRRNLVVIDSLYWLFLGMPLVWLFYGVLMGMETIPATLILLKQPVNGVFNALIATQILYIFARYGKTNAIFRSNIQKDASREMAYISFQEVISNLLVTTITITVFCIIVWQGRLTISQLENNLYRDVNHMSVELAGKAKQWYQQQKNILNALAQSISPDMESSTIQTQTELFYQAFPDFWRIYVINSQGTAIAAEPKRSEFGEKLVGENFSNSDVFQKVRQTQYPKVGKVRGYAFQTIPHFATAVPIVADSQFAGIVYGSVRLNHLQDFLEEITQNWSNPEKIPTQSILENIEVLFLDSRDRIIASNQSQQLLETWKPEGKQREIANNFNQWLPEQDNLATMKQWQQSSYILQQPLYGSLPWTLVIQVPAAPQVKSLQTTYIQYLSVIFIAATIALFIAPLISRQLTSSLNQLTELTKDLPQKIFQKQSIDWNQSSIREVNFLVRNFREMSISLSNKIQELEQAQERFKNQAIELETTLKELQETQSQLIQQEKMSSLGQLVAGVAHEINNPVNFIYGNITYTKEYTQDLLYIVELYRQETASPSDRIQEATETVDLDFIREDLPKLLDSMQVGSQRIQEIVKSLRTFSRLDESEAKEVDIHECIDSTLMILQHRLKSKNHCPEIQVVKQYDRFPPIYCYPGLLNQVFMNLLSNAIDAIEEANYNYTNSHPPQITIQTELQKSDRIAIRIRDNGVGIPESVKSKIFDPFFTTKQVGKGTGLGLSISYKIVVEKHHGTMACHSEPQQGTEFVLEIPHRQIKS